MEGRGEKEGRREEWRGGVRRTGGDRERGGGEGDEKVPKHRILLRTELTAK